MQAPPTNSRADLLNGILAICLATATFALMSAMAKSVLDRYPLSEVMLFRAGFGLVPVMVVLGWQGRFASLRTRRIKAHLTRGACGIIAMACAFASYHLMPLADATAIGFTAPLFMTALSWPLLGERVGVARWLAVVAGFLGILVMVRPGDADFGLGAALAVLGSLVYAFAVITMRQLTRTDPPTSVAFYNQGTVVLAVLIPVMWQWQTPTLTDAAVLVAIGLAGGSAQIWMTKGIQLTPVAVGAPFNYTQMVWAVLLGFLMFGEVPQWATLVGAAIVAGSGLFIVLRERGR